MNQLHLLYLLILTTLSCQSQDSVRHLSLTYKLDITSKDTLTFSPQMAAEAKESVSSTIADRYYISADKVVAVDRIEKGDSVFHVRVIHDLISDVTYTINEERRSIHIDSTISKKTMEALPTEVELIDQATEEGELLGYTTVRQTYAVMGMPGEVNMDVTKDIAIPKSYLLGQFAFGLEYLPMRITTDVMGLKMIISVADVREDVDLNVYEFDRGKYREVGELWEIY